jgi:gamma-glutamylcyclotransferase (GGCT)/AIG2-like uncharacterized protein YtfP
MDLASIDDRPVVAVYGTLRRGCRNHGLLEGAEPLGDGLVDGTLWLVDTKEQRAYPYPALLLGGASQVVVECFRITGPSQLAALDRLESFDPDDEAGSEYVRRTVPVAGARVPTAQVYVYRGLREHLARPIPNGDWVANGGG